MNFKGKHGFERMLGFTSDGGTLLQGGGWGGQIDFINLETGNELDPIKWGYSAPYHSCMAFSADGNTLAVGMRHPGNIWLKQSGTWEAGLWDLKMSKPVGRIPCESSPDQIEISPNSELIAIGEDADSTGRTVKVWDLSADLHRNAK